MSTSAAADLSDSITAIDPLARGPATSRRDRAIQLGALVVAGAFLLWVNRKQWFVADEWNMLVDRRLVGGDGHLGIWDAHNSHLAATVTVVYRALFELFGVRTYLPYLVVLVLTLLALMYVTWRLLLRLGIFPLLATLGSLLVVLYGEGWEITTGAFGIQNAGALAFGLGAFLAMPTAHTIVRRDALVLGLLVLSLGTSSGVAVPIVVVTGLIAWTRRGWQPALLTVAVPGVLFAIWYALHGEQATEAQGALGTGEAIRGAPTFVAHGLWWAFEDLFDLGGGGPFLLLGAVVLVACAVRIREAAWHVALAFALGAPLYLAVTTLGRGGFGVEIAGSSRYAFVVLVFLLPALVLALDRLARRFPTRRVSLAVVAVLLAALVVLQAVVLDDHATRQATIEQESKRRIVAAAELLRPGVEAIGAPVPELEPSLTPAKLAALDREGALPGNVRPSRVDRLTAELALFVASSEAPPLDANRALGAQIVGGAPVRPAEPAGCVRTPRLGRGDVVRLRFPQGGSVRVDTPRAGVFLRLRFEEAGVRSRVRTMGFPASQEMLLVDLAERPTLVVATNKPASLRLCGGL